MHYVVLTALVCAVLALGFVLLQKPYFRSAAELLVDTDRGPVVGTDGTAPATSAADAQQAVGSQIYILQSRELLRDVVKRLDLVSDPYLAASGGGLRQRLFGGSHPADPGDRTDAVVSALQKNLTVERQADSLVFTVTVRHRNSDMAAKIANAIAESYLRTTDASRADSNLRLSMALQVQADGLRKRLLEAQAAVETFRAENGLISTGQQGLVSDQQLVGLNQQLLAASQLVEQQRTISEQARQLNLSDVESGAIPEALQSTSLSSLRVRYAQMLERQAELSANLGNGHPQMRAARSQVASMGQTIENELGRIRQSTENSYQRARSNLAALQKRFDELTATNSKSGQARIRLAQLQSEAASIDAVYKSFLTRAEELGRQQDIATGNSRIISPAVASATPVQAPKLLVLIAAVLFGMAAGSVLAVLRELVSATVRSERDLVTKTGAPVLAVLNGPAELRREDTGRFVRAKAFLRRRRSAGQTKRRPGGEAGALRAAQLIRAEFARNLPATVVVLSASKDGDEAAAADIARELHNLGESVFLSDGGLNRQARPSLSSGGGSVRIRTAVARAADESRLAAHPLGDILRFERVGGAAAHKVTALSSARVSTDISRPGATFYVVDACGTPAADMLPAVLRHADGILVLCALGSTASGDLSALMSEIEPWREKLIGNILVASRAA